MTDNDRFIAACWVGLVSLLALTALLWAACDTVMR